MPSEIAKKALENNAITQKQYDKLPAPLLDKVAKHNLELQKKARKKPARGGVKEVHKKQVVKHTKKDDLEKVQK